MQWPLIITKTSPAAALQPKFSDFPNEKSSLDIFTVLQFFLYAISKVLSVEPESTTITS